MKKTPGITASLVTALLVLFTINSTYAQLTNGLVAYWPLSQITGCNYDTTPELVHGYDMRTVYGTAQPGTALAYTNFNSSFDLTTNSLYLTNDSPFSSGPYTNSVYFPTYNQSNGYPMVALAYQSVNTNDFVPINRSSPGTNTISFMIKGPPDVQGGGNYVRFFAELDFIRTLASVFDLEPDGPSGGQVLNFFTRQNPPTPDPLNYGNFSGGAHTVGSLNVLDGNWHNVTVETVPDDSGTNSGTWEIWVDGIQDPSFAVTKPSGTWKLDTVCVGALCRNGTPGFSYLTNCEICSLAEWNRNLTTNEMLQFAAQGITNTFAPASPLVIGSFNADLYDVAKGSQIVLGWNVSSDATGISINNGIGNVLPDTSCGIGSITITPTVSATYTLTLTRNAEPPLTQSINIVVVNGVAPGWQFVDNFNYDMLGWLGEQGNWDSLLNAPTSGTCDPANVISTTSGNQVLTLTGPKVLSGANLGNESIGINGSNTLFFRFYLDPRINSPDTNNAGGIDDEDIYIGLSDLTLRDPADFTGNPFSAEGGTADRGPSINISRVTSALQGGPVDFMADFGGNSPSGYSYIADTVNGNSSGLSTGVVYSVWMDVLKVQNDPVANASSYFSVWLQAGSNSPALLFSNQISDRGTNSNPTLNKVFIASSTDTPQGSNTVMLDDFYLSTNGYNHTVPAPAGGFVQGPPPAAPSSIQITSVKLGGHSVVLNWSTVPPGTGAYTFTVWRSAALNSGSWTKLQANISSTTYTDTTETGSQSFYRVSSP